MVFLVAFLVARSSGADETVPVFLTFAGAPGCEDSAQLEREVTTRSQNVVFTRDAAAPTRIEVRVANGTGRVDSVMVIDREAEPQVMRAVTGVDCQEVLEATGLIIAVLLMPRTDAPVSPPTDDGTSATTTTPRRVSFPPETPARPTRWRFGGGVSAVMMAGIAPEALPGIEGALDLALDRPGWSPAFRLGVRQVRRAGVDFEAGRVAFRLTVGSAAACPLAWIPSKAWSLRPCLHTSVGVLQASAYRSEQHPWVSVGGGLRVGAALHRVLSLELQAASEVSVGEGQFRFGNVQVHETSPVIGWLGLGVMTRFP